ncbi:MAG: methyltransferase [Erythrobacter sp.]
MTALDVPQIFHRSRAAKKWARARARQAQLGGATYLNDTIANDVLERLEFMRFEPKAPLIIGDAGNLMPSAFNSQGVPTNVARLGELNEEEPGPPEKFDLIVHLLGLAMVNDLPGALIHARSSLTAGGLFIGALPGAGSLPNLRQLALAADGDRPAARIHPQIDIRAATGLLERAGFKRQVVDSYPIRVRFPSIERMISDLRDHGLTASLTTNSPPLTRTGWSRASELFETLREDDGKVSETFEILVLTGWKN